jgi:hypothetical protein
MRAFLPACLMIVLVACAASTKPVPVELRKKAQIENDLRLDVGWQGPRQVEPGVDLAVDLTLVNTSKTQTYRVVKPGDGSEVGWREPYVYFTASVLLADGKRSPVPPAGYGRCGLFAFDWGPDVMELKPGQSLPLKTWVPAPSQMLEFQQAGKVQLRAHYAYRGGKGIRSPALAAAHKFMKGVPDFEIVSAPVEFEVVRPLELKVRVKKALKVKAQTRLSDLLEVTLLNQSSTPQPVTVPTLHGDARLEIEIDGQLGGWRPEVSKQLNKEGKQHVLKPGQKTSLFGRGPLANGLDGSWSYPIPDTVRLRAIYRRSTWKPASVIKSSWVEVKVEKNVDRGP